MLVKGCHKRQEWRGIMIEIICDSDNDNKSKDGSKKNTVIRTPKNIKQIGDVSSDKKIFIEDYAFSYINSLAYGLDGQEQSGVLLGEYHKTSSEKCLFIKGVVKKKSTQTHDDRPGFNENVWSSIYSDIEKYFPKLEVVGWFAAIPGITPEWMEYLKKIHKDNFTGGLKTLYIVDIREKTENFYLYENGRLKKQSGYVCYYERNYEMQEYMLQKRGRHSVESSEKDKVMQSIREIINNKEQIQHQKKNMMFVYGAGSVLAVIVLVLGINLMNSYTKMQSFDNSLTTIVKQIADINSNEDDDNAKDTASSGIVPVNKLTGDVYPTEEDTQAETDTAGKNVAEMSQDETQRQNMSQEKTSVIETENVQAELQNEQNDKVESVNMEQTQAEKKEQSVSSETGGNQSVQSAGVTYIVKKGDTIMSICQNYYGTVKKYPEVAAANNLDDVNKLYIGQEIKLP